VPPPRTLSFPLKIFGVETVKKAAYRFSDMLSVEIVLQPDATECILHFPADYTDEAQCDSVVAAFRSEVLDQDLRSIVSKETEATRNAVLAFALSKTGLQGGE
jgi:His-Xaa-Ser system protein HxsD